MNDNNKIQTLEETLAHQARTIEEMNDALTDQWKSIDGLEKKMAALVERFLALEEAGESSIENTRPPHY